MMAPSKWDAGTVDLTVNGRVYRVDVRSAYSSARASYLWSVDFAGVSLGAIHTNLEAALLEAAAELEKL
jgi:hypothetical protein